PPGHHRRRQRLRGGARLRALGDARADHREVGSAAGRGRPRRVVMLAAILFALNLDLARASAQQVGVTTIYDPSYVQLRYPGGDLPPERGVCADVIVRAFRNIGVDLQREVHEDMRAHFAAYPQLWGL